MKDESGTKNTSKITKSYTIIHDIKEYDLSYNTASAITIGDEDIFSPTTTDTNPIPANANVTYKISATSNSDTLLDNITMNTSTIHVANTTPIGSYNLTVTATPNNENYSGKKTVAVTIKVAAIDISIFNLVYDVSTPATTKATEKYPIISSNIPDEAQVSYSISGDRKPSSITINSSTGEITAGTQFISANTYILTVTATPTVSKYTGTKTVEFSFVVID